MTTCRPISFCWLALFVFSVVALYPRFGFAAHPCDVHKVAAQKDACLKQYAENERKAAEEARKRQAAIEAQRQVELKRKQEQQRLEEQERRRQAEVAAKKQVEERRLAEQRQREVDERKRQAAIEAKKKQDDELRQKEAERLAENQRQLEAKRLAEVARKKKEDDDLRLARERELITKKGLVVPPAPTFSPTNTSQSTPQLAKDFGSSGASGLANLQRTPDKPVPALLVSPVIVGGANSGATTQNTAPIIDKTPQQPPATSNSSGTEIEAEVKRRLAAQKGTGPAPVVTSQTATTVQASSTPQAPVSTATPNAGKTQAPSTTQAVPLGKTTSATTLDQQKLDNEVKRRMALQSTGNTLQTAGSTPQTAPSAKSFISACGSGWQAVAGQVHEIGNVLLTGVSFQSSCQAHDACYARADCKTSKKMCDNALYADMVNDCSRAASGNIRQTCAAQAKNFLWLVETFGDGPFTNARKSLNCSAVKAPDTTFSTSTAGSNMQSLSSGQGAQTTSAGKSIQGSTPYPALGNANSTQNPVPANAGSSPAASSTTGKRYPLDSPVTQGFNVPWSVTLERDYKGVAKTHTGVDIAAGKGTIVRAMTDGVVHKISQMGAEWGQGVVVREANGTAKAYLHVSPVVKEGSPIKAGQEIGKVWKDHLHYNVCTRVQFCERGALPTSVKNPELPGDPLFKDGPFVKP